MSLTTAFLFLFITIVIPGFIFQRIYFYGDFSKQFTTRENVSKLLLTSLIPGLIISAVFLTCYNYFFLDDVKIEDILTLFEKLAKNKAHEDAGSLGVFGNYRSFLFYCFLESIFSGALGFLLSRGIVRGLKLDRRWKTLRYKNQWYYVFSGEVFEFQKFKLATKTLSKKSRKGKDVELARADIMIKGAEGEELYTGYVADYDLNAADISKLDNIYLLDAIRHNTSESPLVSAGEKPLKRVEKKMIPGELFVLNLANVININVSYLLAPTKEKIPGEISRSFSLAVRLLVFIVLLPATVFIFYNPSWMDWFRFSEIKWYHKLLFFSLYMNIVSSIFPRYDHDKKAYYYKKQDLFLALAIALGTISYYFLIRHSIHA